MQVIRQEAYQREDYSCQHAAEDELEEVERACVHEEEVEKEASKESKLEALAQEGGEEIRVDKHLEQTGQMRNLRQAVKLLALSNSLVQPRNGIN